MARRVEDTKIKKYDLEERLIDFAASIVDLVEELPATRVGNHIAGQILRSGTSPAPNYGEAQSAESRRDFIHKMKLVLKELRETRVWILLLQKKSLVESPETLQSMLDESNQLISIFVSSIATASREESQKN